MVVAGVMSPILGAVADHGGLKKRFLLIFTVICIVFSAALFFVGPGRIVFGMVMFLIANIAFQGAMVFYNAFLPELGPPDRMGRISGYGWGLGYIGSIVIMALCIPLLAGGFKNMVNIRLTFVIQAAFYLAFAWPLFVWLPERPGVVTTRRFDLGAGFRRLKETARHLGRYRELVKFFIAYVAYYEGVTTVIWFATIFARTTFGFTMMDLVVFFLVVQTTGVIGAVALGRLADLMSAKWVIMITLGIWIVMVTGAYLTTSRAVFWGLGVLAGVGLGSCQAVSRTLMGRLTPPGKRGEFFAFYGVVGKFSAAIGPLLFGLISSLAGSQRPAILAVGGFFVVGGLILLTVDEAAGEAAARDSGRSN